MLEFFKQPYTDIMAMPSPRRHRFVLRKLEAEKQKAAQMEAASAKMRTSRRR